jgi:hypothetical protein
MRIVNVAPEPICSGCNLQGRPPEPLIWDRATKPPPVLTVVSGWGDGTALLCPKCRRRLHKNRGRARYSPSRPSDGRLT